MELQDFIGQQLDEVKKQLDKLQLKYKVIESSDIQKKFDTILVTRVTKQNDIVLLVTDKFLLNI